MRYRGKKHVKITTSCPHPNALSMTCRQMRTESKGTIYNINTFRLDTGARADEDVTRFLKQVGKANAKEIRRLDIYCEDFVQQIDPEERDADEVDEDSEMYLSVAGMLSKPGIAGELDADCVVALVFPVYFQGRVGRSSDFELSLTNPDNFTASVEKVVGELQAKIDGSSKAASQVAAEVALNLSDFAEEVGIEHYKVRRMVRRGRYL